MFIDPTKKTRDPQFCSLEEGGGFKLEASCYHLITDSRTWDEAEDFCKEKFNGHLVTVLDSTVDMFLTHMLSDLNGKVWIGIKIKVSVQF